MARTVTYDEDTIAVILAEASFWGWASVVLKYKIGKTTFFRYKSQLKTNPSLKEKYEKHRVFIMINSYKASEDFLTTTYQELTKKIQAGSIRLEDPRVILALAQMMKNASEYQIANGVLNGDDDESNDVN